MVRLLQIGLLIGTGALAAAKHGPWQDALVARVVFLTVRTAQPSYSVTPTHPVPYAPVPTIPASIVSRRSRAWLYGFQAGPRVYWAIVRRKPLAGIKAGDTVRVAVDKERISWRVSARHERRLERLVLK